MTKRMTDAIREEAVLLCAVAASTRQWGLDVEAGALGVSADALKLARGAWYAAEKTNRIPSFGNEWDRSWAIYFENCAEAECLLRTGWTP